MKIKRETMGVRGDIVYNTNTEVFESTEIMENIVG
jgi:hypothetical protein